MTFTASSCNTTWPYSQHRLTRSSAPLKRKGLLFISTDRISAYNVILKRGIPDKGKLLTELSLFWFKKLEHIVSNHFVTANIDEMPEEVKRCKDQLEARTMLVRKAKIVQMEAIVRGHLTGYGKSGTVHGISLPSGLKESQRLPKPLFTPSTKAEQGTHDENISPEQAKLLGEELYTRIFQAYHKLYSEAAEYALSNSRGYQVRIWACGYEAGKPQPSFDKQYLRDWLIPAGFRKGFESGKEGEEGKGWVIDEDVVTRK
ncbi:hypothetical protein L218DRAFT_975310 [Marasmius fiardii PR-910]|nr:hypothetical protein L218DRAFT_975310 [Marasmius fiardii PR-910]